MLTSDPRLAPKEQARTWGTGFREFESPLKPNARLSGPPAKALEAKHVWQARLYDFNVWSEKKRVEKLRYMHRNPVRRGLVREPEEWRWSSFRHYAFGERGAVLVNEQRPTVLRIKGKALRQREGLQVS